MNSSTHEWEVTDPSLGAGLALGPSGATMLTRDPKKGQDAYEQALRVGPDGVVLGPNNASAQVDRTADLAQGTLGVDNLHLGPSGVLINNGSPLNSSVKVHIRRLLGEASALMLQGAPSGFCRLSFGANAGDSERTYDPGQPHRIRSEPLLCQAKPAAREPAGAVTITAPRPDACSGLGPQPRRPFGVQVLGQAANGSLNNVQISLGDTNKTAGEQTSGFHSYELHGNGSVGAASNATLANPYFATNSAGKASVWGPASAPVHGPSAAPLAAGPSASALAVQAGSLPQRFGGVGGSDAGAAPAAVVGASGSLQSAQQAASADRGAVNQGAVAQSAGEILPSPAAALPLAAGQGGNQGLDREHGHAPREYALRQDSHGTAPDVQAVETSPGTGSTASAPAGAAGSTRSVAAPAEASAQQRAGHTSTSAGQPVSGAGRRRLRGWHS